MCYIAQFESVLLMENRVKSSKKVRENKWKHMVVEVVEKASEIMNEGNKIK